jgi:hypothetical protein
MFVLLIDDKREFEGARVARTFADGIAALQERQWDLVLLDHDLGDFTGPNGRELTGYDVACFLEAFPENMPNDVLVVSSNSSGIPRVIAALQQFYPDKRRWQWMNMEGPRPPQWDGEVRRYRTRG